MEKDFTVKEVECKTALHRLKRRYPYSWDLNIFRGCQHGCIYCYAQDCHVKQKKKQISQEVEVKVNIPEILEAEISSPGWNHEIINIGGVTDSYQPLEEQYELMPRILQACIRHKTPVIISTKSDLILRDMDLIKELAEVTYVNVAATITVMEEGIRRIIEPGASPANARFAMLRQFAGTKASRGLHVMPIVPYLTDDARNLEELFSKAADSQVSYALCGTLYLRGFVKSFFLEKMEYEFPETALRLEQLYRTGSASKEYKDNLYKRVNHWRKKYQITGEYSRFIKERLKS